MYISAHMLCKPSLYRMHSAVMHVMVSCCAYSFKAVCCACIYGCMHGCILHSLNHEPPSCKFDSHGKDWSPAWDLEVCIQVWTRVWMYVAAWGVGFRSQLRVEVAVVPGQTPDIDRDSQHSVYKGP